MDSSKIVALVLGMTLVTYIPRALPFLLIGKMNFSGKLEKFLKLTLRNIWFYFRCWL